MTMERGEKKRADAIEFIVDFQIAWAKKSGIKQNDILNDLPKCTFKRESFNILHWNDIKFDHELEVNQL